MLRMKMYTLLHAFELIVEVILLHFWGISNTFIFNASIASSGVEKCTGWKRSISELSQDYTADD